MDPNTGLWGSYKKSIPRTVIVQQYFKYCGAIDRGNRVRQDGFRLEKNFEVKQWENRVIISLWGFVCANAYLGAKLEGCDENQSDWQEGLALEMLTNTLEGCPTNAGPATRSVVPPGGIALVPGTTISEPAAPKRVDDATVGTLRHNFQKVSILQTSTGSKTTKGTCKICQNPDATLFCISCSKSSNGGTQFVCGPSTGRQCLSWHCQLS